MASGRLNDHVAIVTGAGQGIGLGIARRLAAEGCSVVVAEISEDTGANAASELTALGGEARFVHTDVADRSSIEAAVATTLAEFGRVDVLVNNAFAMGEMSRLETKPTEHFELALGVCFYGTLWGMQAVFPHMRTQGRGRIVNLVSLAGINAHPFESDYNVAKESVRSLTMNAAREWARYGIVVNAIAPFATTPAFVAFSESAPDAAAMILGHVPVGRMGDPEQDIGGVAVFLSSDDARYVTGNVIHADGGAHINGITWEPPIA
jgi:NAD(P)-dependent dehydrogenase (short-subunit alcohol dehydrogenase family)